MVTQISVRRVVIEEYWKHTALNLGQAVRDIRYFYYHPDADRISSEGLPKHYAYSIFRRINSFGNNLFYSVLPPHWHHTKEDLENLRPATTREWFLHGYAPWRFPDPVKQKKQAGSPAVEVKK